MSDLIIPSHAVSSDYTWFTVATEKLTFQVALPANRAEWTAAHQRKFENLKALAKRHATVVHQSQSE